MLILKSASPFCGLFSGSDLVSQLKMCLLIVSDCSPEPLWPEWFPSLPPATLHPSQGLKQPVLVGIIIFSLSLVLGRVWPVGCAHKYVLRGQEESEVGMSIPHPCRISVLLVRGLPSLGCCVGFSLAAARGSYSLVAVHRLVVASRCRLQALGT